MSFMQFKQRSKGVRYALNLLVLVTFLFSNFGLGYAFDAKTSMLRQSSANSRLETTVAAMGIELLQDAYARGGRAELVKLLSDRAIDGVTDPVEEGLIKAGVAVLERDGKTYLIGVIGNGWRLDLSNTANSIEPFASTDERDQFISGGQLTWIAGKYTPAELIDAQSDTKKYLERAGSEDRIFVADNLPAQVARYSATRTSVARQLPPLATHENPAKDEQKKMVARLQAAFDFHNQAINSIGALDIPLMFSGNELEDSTIAGAYKAITDGLKKVRQAVVFDEENNPSFFFAGEAGSSKFLAVTASSGGYKYAGYDYEQSGRTPPRSIYENLAMIESYMEMAKTDPDALKAYRLKLLHEYIEVTLDSKFHRKESSVVTALINKYDAKALEMWKGREEKKATDKLAKENKKVVAEAFSANIAKFLNLDLGEVIPDAVIASVNQGLQSLVESGLLTDFKVFANAGDIHVVTTRQNKNAIQDDAKILPAIIDVFVGALEVAKEQGVYVGEDLTIKPYLEQVRALEIRVPFQPMKYSERAADPFAVISASNTYVGAFNLLIWDMFSNPMYNAGLTIDPYAMRGYIFEVWDSIENKVYRFDAETENTKLRAVANQPGRYAIVAVYTKPEGKVASDEPLVMVTVKRVADDGNAGVGDFSPVLMARAQSSLPAWGELIAPFGTAMPIISYGGDKTKGIVAFRPTAITEANKIPASQREGLSLLAGFGFQSNDNGHFGRTEDIGGHQTLNIVRSNAERWAKIFFSETLPKWMDHITKLEPFKRPHTYDRDDQVVATRKRLDGRFERNPDLKGGEKDPLLNKAVPSVAFAVSNIKADIGSVPGHYKPHNVTINAINQMLELAKKYDFKAVDEYIALANAVMLLRTGMTIDEVASAKGVYRKQGSEALMKKVAEFKRTVKINNWDEAVAYVKEKTNNNKNILFALGLLSAAFSSESYASVMERINAAAKGEARAYFALTESRNPTEAEIEILATMIGLTAKAADQDLGFFNLKEEPSGLFRIFDYKVWSSGDDCQLTLKHKRLAEDAAIHTLAWNALWYAADQTSYFKPYGWKQDILVDRLVSGNIQGAGPGYAEVQLKEGEDVLVFSADKCAPGAFTVPILGMIRQALNLGRFKNGVIAEIWDINNRPRAFFDLSDSKQYADVLALLSSPEEFAIKRVWTAVESGGQVVTDAAGKQKRIDDVPLIAASTERLVLTAGEYVGKDDPTLLVRITTNANDRFNVGDVVDVFQYPQVTLGFMRGSHVGPLVPGTQPSFFLGKDRPADFQPEATPHLFDGPPPLAGFYLAQGEFSSAKDVFGEMVPWLKSAIDQGNFMTQVLRRQGWNPPHKVEGPDTEYTTWPIVMAAIEAEGRAKPASNVMEEQLLKSALALQSSGVSHKLSQAVLGVAKDAANKKVVLISASVLRSDPTLILALQSINEQINQSLGIFGSTANVEANAYQFVLVADDAQLTTAKDIDTFFAAIAKATNNGVVVNKDIFADIITQEDMFEGQISNAVDLLKQLNRMGTGESVVALVGSERWTERLKTDDNVVVVNVGAQENKVAFASNGLFGAVETLATADKKLPEPIVEQLDIALLPSGAMEVKQEEVNRRVSDEITTYRATVRAI
ncbi:MAG: fructose 1,6-bisphosphatase [Candidatus Omnitrophica bacterium]|nr:fructose 1,6-bisphosphatase [Candidatus Omnitrophota bacterium]